MLLFPALWWPLATATGFWLLNTKAKNLYSHWLILLPTFRLPVFLLLASYFLLLASYFLLLTPDFWLLNSDSLSCSMNVRLSNRQKIEVLNSADIFTIMQAILLRENKIRRNLEHFPCPCWCSSPTITPNPTLIFKC